MRNLLNFLTKYNHLIIFVMLQGISFFLLSTGNNYHNSRVTRSIKFVTAGMEQRISDVRSWFRLREINKNLATDNAILRAQIEELSSREENTYFPVSDTNSFKQYTYTAAQVINNSVNRQKNYFTLDKGNLQGVNVDMAVSSGSSVAGVVISCSDNYSVTMSLINVDFRLSARIRSNGYFGSLSWDGRDIRYAVLNEIPQHVTFGIGDTIETTGYSAVFPEGMLIGRISGFEKSGGDFYRINVELFTDFRKIHFVNVTENLRKEEQRELEKSFK
jgi:rod shape-determining protein MreC